MRAKIIRWLLGLSMPILATPAIAATTIATPATINVYRDASTTAATPQFRDSNAFSNAAIVGRILNYANTNLAIWNGQYATTMEFALPSIPVGATISSAVLAIEDGSRAGDILVRSYTAATIARDAARIYAGNTFATFHSPDTSSGQQERSFDVTSFINASLANGLGSGAVGFSFRQVANNCTFDPASGCWNSLGGASGHITPELRITYVTATLPPAVPEPSTWMMMIVGLGTIGVTMRHRQGNVQRVRAYRTL